MKIHLETDRFILRDIEESDVEGMFLLDSDPEVHEYLGKKPIKTRKEAEAVIQYIRKQYADNGIGRWAIVDKKTNDFIGWTGLKYEEGVREFGYYDLGYRLRKNYWGQGIGTETALASLNYGFAKMDLPEISGGAELGNLGSNKILKKVGLRFVETFVFDGETLNWYSLKKADWEALNMK